MMTLVLQALAAMEHIVRGHHVSHHRERAIRLHCTGNPAHHRLNRYQNTRYRPAIQSSFSWNPPGISPPVLPSPLAGEGPGVRGIMSHEPHGTHSTGIPATTPDFPKTSHMKKKTQGQTLPVTH